MSKRGRGRHGLDPNLHTVDDGRGQRQVLVDGRPVTHVFWAHIGRGIVRAYRQPFKLDKRRKRGLSYTLRGRVEVKIERQQ